MRDLLYKELLDQGLMPLTDLTGDPESVVLYLRNKSTSNVRGQIVTPGVTAENDISKPKDPETGTTYVLANQNPSLKIYPRGDLLDSNQVAFCLSKGLLISTAEFFKLDDVAYESALNLITNPNQRLQSTDYDLTVTGSTAQFKFDDTITGTRYTILGLRGLNYNLIEMNGRFDDSSIMLRHNTNLAWTLFQLKNLLVYQENGEAVLPVFIKWDITAPEGNLVIPAIANEVSNGLRMAVGDDNILFSLDWDGYNKDITYRDGEASINIVSGCQNCEQQIDTSWDIEYVLNGNTVRALTGDPIPNGYADINNRPEVDQITSLIINNTITDVGNFAFFQWSSSQSLIIPDSVAKIGDSAFRNWESATELSIPSSVVEIGAGAFGNWLSTTSLTIPEGVVHITSSAFNGWNSATTLIIPESVNFIGQQAFGAWYSCQSITVKNPIPPTAEYHMFMETPNVPIYVPAASVAAYKAATGWDQYADQIFAIP